MLKALRRKFVLVSMALVTLILTAVLLTGIISTRMQFIRDYRAVELEPSIDIKRPRRDAFWTYRRRLASLRSHPRLPLLLFKTAPAAGS